MENDESGAEDFVDGGRHIDEFTDVDRFVSFVGALETTELFDAVGQDRDRLLGFVFEVDQVILLQVKKIPDGEFGLSEQGHEFDVAHVEVFGEAVAPGIIFLILLTLESGIETTANRLDHGVRNAEGYRHRGPSDFHIEGDNNHNLTVRNDRDKLRIGLGPGIIDLDREYRTP